MPLKRLQLKNFRLFTDDLYCFSKGVNLILGKNGSGKTSILESIDILFNGGSFRSLNTKDCIKQGENSFEIICKGLLNDKEYILSVENSHTSRTKSQRKINSKPAKKENLAFLQLVLAKHLKMIEGEPELRREHTNHLMFHVKPGTKKLDTNYQKALKQRNRCLKKNLSDRELSLWTSEVSKLGLELSLKQYDFFKLYRAALKDYLKRTLDNGSFKFLEGLDITFSKGWERNKKLEESLIESLDRDKALGYSSKGPHRMDFTFVLNKKNAANQLSRGQLKILILLSFLSNLKLLQSLHNSETLLLIDDLSSELDSDNLTEILIEILKANSQIILTGIEGEEIHNSIKKLTNFTQINL